MARWAAVAALFCVIPAFVRFEVNVFSLHRRDGGGIARISAGEQFGRRVVILLGNAAIKERQSVNLIIDDLSEQHPEAGLSVPSVPVSVVDAAENRHEDRIIIRVFDPANSNFGFSRIAGENGDPADLVAIASRPRSDTLCPFWSIQLISPRISRMDGYLWKHSDVDRRNSTVIFEGDFQKNIDAFVPVPLGESDWPRYRDNGSYPRPVRIQSGLSLGSSGVGRFGSVAYRFPGKDEAETNKQKSHKGDNCPYGCDPIQAMGGPKLPTPEIPLMGAVACFFGNRFLWRGLSRGLWRSHLAGWLLIFFGSGALILWVVPFGTKLLWCVTSS